MERIIEQTTSICPKCHKIIDAKVVDRHGSAYFEKNCDEHGLFEGRISKYTWFYEGLNDFYNKIYSGRYCFGLKEISDYQFFPRLNPKLNYDIFFSDFRNPTLDTSLEKFREMVRSIKGPKGKTIMLGGEPTERSDLPDFIKIISEEGYRAWVYSNGFMLQDLKYLRSLRESGLVFTWLWVDTLRDDGIYEKIRGRRFLFEKKQILENFKILNMPLGIILTIVRGINEQEIEHVFSFARENNFIKALVVKTYSDVGQKKFSPQAEFTMDELAELISDKNYSPLTIREFYIFQKMVYVLFSFSKKPSCYLKQFVYIPRNKKRKLQDIIDLARLEPSLDRFAEIYQESPLKAKVYFLKEILRKCIRNPLFLFLLCWEKFPKGSNYFLRLDLSAYYTEINYDLNKIRCRCNDIWLPSLCSGKPIDFCRMLINSFTDEAL